MRCIGAIATLAAATCAAGAAPQGWASNVVDFTGDGRPDLLTRSGTNVYVHAGATGGWSFGPPVVWAQPKGRWKPVAAADFNGDLSGDLVVQKGARIKIYTGAVDHAVAAGDPAGIALEDKHKVAAAGDLDGDGRADLVVQRREVVAVYPNSGMSTNGLDGFSGPASFAAKKKFDVFGVIRAEEYIRAVLLMGKGRFHARTLGGATLSSPGGPLNESFRAGAAIHDGDGPACAFLMQSNRTVAVIYSRGTQTFTGSFTLEKRARLFGPR